MPDNEEDCRSAQESTVNVLEDHNQMAGEEDDQNNAYSATGENKVTDPWKEKTLKE